jgi:hypothetical protein
MSHAITLTLPDLLFEPVQRIARATNQPVEAVLLKALQVSLPPLDGLPGDMADALAGLEELDNASLHRVMREHVSADDQDEMAELVDRLQAGEASEGDIERLNVLRGQADRVMLRKARAAVILRFRGERIPTEAELRRELALSR